MKEHPISGIQKKQQHQIWHDINCFNFIETSRREPIMVTSTEGSHGSARLGG